MSLLTRHPVPPRDRMAELRAQGAQMPISYRTSQVMPLGTVERRGRTRIFVACEGREFEVGQPAVALTAGSYFLERGRNDFLTLREVAIGTYHSLALAPPAQATRPTERPHRRSAVLAALAMFAAKPFTPPNKEGRPAASGGEELTARIVAKGIILHPVTSSRKLYATAPGGTIPPDQLDAIRAASPLVLPFLLGEPAPDCELPEHADESPHPATTIYAVDVLGCDR